ncbi:uncharacterized protein EAE97_011310 [Botrytis byssoidea]|uniref:Uncharacterized protein n=1 Tax=Botrytis byssoidea TaxID=139641 RepID=A0A9P5LSN0_9HELO|nr:uncharacterized protein EAE97_011310 [Botrytis byssoidea]KAF7921521.1 hypothetical protein EAE97_011310 [Botrytis byssoidea]
MSPSWMLGSAFSMLLSTIVALDFPAYPGLRLNQSRAGVLEVAFNNPPVNVWGLETIDGLTDIVERLRNDTDTKVVLFTSDIAGFFVNHLDLLITPFGAGRSNFLPRLIGRGRAMEYILSGNDIGAVEAAEIGWINKAFEFTPEMYSHIDALISRFVLFSLPAIGLAKQSINAATKPTLIELKADADRFLQTLSNPDVPVLIGKALALAQNQTDTFAENFFGEVIPQLYS